MKSLWISLAVFVVLAAVVTYRSVLFVDQTQLVIVTEFGRPVATYRQAGLKFKLPYQSAIRIDRRLQIYDPRPSEFLAGEKKNINLDVFVCWKVKEPLRFLETVTDIPGAEARLHDIVWSELAAEVGKRPLEAIVSTDEATHRLEELVETVAAACRARVDSKDGYGIEIVDVGLKRISYPKEVRESVFQRMRAERARMASRYRAEGEEESLKIRAEADRQRTVTLADAKAESERIRGDAEAEATRIYAEAHSRDPRFYEVQRKLEAYKKFLDEKTTILLSADSDLLKYLTEAPEAEASTDFDRSLAESAADGSEP
jgi:membrane protease subunit HflC